VSDSSPALTWPPYIPTGLSIQSFPVLSGAFHTFPLLLRHLPECCLGFLAHPRQNMLLCNITTIDHRPRPTCRSTAPAPTPAWLGTPARPCSWVSSGAQPQAGLARSVHSSLVGCVTEPQSAPGECRGRRSCPSASHAEYACRRNGTL
jgi:hypothetical protein